MARQCDKKNSEETWTPHNIFELAEKISDGTIQEFVCNGITIPVSEIKRLIRTDGHRTIMVDI